MDKLKTPYRKYFRKEEYEKIEEGTASVSKPKAEAGYVIVKRKIRDPNNPKAFKWGYVKQRKKGVVAKKKTRSKSQRKSDAKKAWRTRKKDQGKLKKSIKRGAATRKANQPKKK